MTDTCHDCGNKYSIISHHWGKSNCSYPEMSEKELNILTGFLMSDGYLDTRYTPKFKTIMSNRKYLQYLDSELGVMGNGVSQYLTAEQSAEKNRNNGANKNAKAENYSDLWSWNTRPHPKFSQFEYWYESGEKVWPDELSLNPTILKHLYCGDGTITEWGQIKISMLNESGNTEKVTEMFRNENLPEPEYNHHETNCNAKFSPEESKELLDYMGDPVPGFEYKWEI